MIFGPTNRKNMVFGINIIVEKVGEAIVFPINKKRIVAEISLICADENLRFGWEYPVIGRNYIHPAIILSNNEYEQIDPKEVAAMLSKTFNLISEQAAILQKACVLIAARRIEKFVYERQTAAVFGGGPIAFRNPGRDLDADPADADQP